MPNPKEVFDDPHKHWSFITAKNDDDFEGQHFDRKEAGRVGDNGLVNRNELHRVKCQTIECISGFANANREGGLLVVGISSTGEVKGTNHLQESQLNSLTSFRDLLRNQAAVAHLIDCKNSTGNPNQVLLVYVPYTENYICETLASPPRAWVRRGKQNVPIDDLMREQLKRDKRIVNFESTCCCPFHIDEVDKAVLHQFRQVFLANAAYDDYDDEQILYQAGAIDRDGDRYVFTNAGFLFFAARPQRILDWAYIRLLRFEVNSSAANSRGLYTFERRFDGPVPQQIRKIRTFFRDSGFFKTYQKRKPDGGFVDDPEFPYAHV
jgi:predicted HTH transcriptional regulator